MDKLRRMEIFNAVADTGQFTRAAKALSLSKSAVSHAINDLENYLQVQLITRSSRGLQLTEAGQAYYRKCQDILAEIDDLEDEARQTQKIIGGRIRLSVPSAYGAFKIAPLIARFSEAHPDINIEMDVTEGVMDIVEEGYDVAIRIGELNDGNLVVRKLSTIKSVLCASPDFAACHSDIQSVHDLSSLNCLRYIRTPIWNLYRQGKLHSLTPQGLIISNCGDAIVQLVMAGSGAGFLPDFLCRAALQDGRLVRLLPEYEGRSLNVYAVLPPHRHRPFRIRRLMDFFIANFDTVTD